MCTPLVNCWEAHPAGPGASVRWWTVLVASWLSDVPTQTAAGWDSAAVVVVVVEDPEKPELKQRLEFLKYKLVWL